MKNLPKTFESRFYARMRLIILLCLFGISTQIYAQQKRIVTGFVYDRVTTKDLRNVKVTILSSDSNVVTVTETGDYVYSPIGDPAHKYPLGNYRFEVPASATPYIMRFSKEGFDTFEQPLDISKMNSRQYSLKVPPIYLTPETTGPVVELDEVVVKTSKIKFYHKGDTIVYNADAFMLPQGSTLDALIAQLPGVEIKDGGKIYVNGKYVESLLLNGKDFFKGNQDVLRQNIGAYTVKDIAVYDKYGNLSKLLDSQLEDDKEYVMDVRLKKDYMGGYLGNIEASYGTDDRYSGRLFAMHFNNNARFTLYGNVNNVNNTNRPNDGQGYYTSSSMQSGIADIANGGFDYYVEDPLKVWSINGNIDTKYITNTLNKNIFSESFLQRNSYQTTYSNSHDKTLTLSTNHELKLNKGLYYFIFKPEFRYNRTRSTSDNSSVEFDTDIQERYDINQKVIDALYTGTPQDLREAIINRNRYNRTHRSNNYRGYFWSEQDFGFKNSPDAIGIWIEGEYNRDHTNSLSDQKIDYGFNGEEAPATSMAYRRKNKQYPDYTGWMKGAIRYYLKVPNGQYSLGYEFRHEEQRKSSMEFLYDSRAEDEEANLPHDTELYPDLGNTRSSKQNFNVHMIKASLEYNLKVASDLRLTVVLSPEFHIRSRTLFYNAYELEDAGYYPVTIPVRRTSSSFNNSSARLVLNTSNWKHRVSLSYNFNTVYASMIDMIDIPNTSDPLNIYRGNPHLKDAFSQYVDMQYSLNPAKNTSYSLYSYLRYYSRDLMKGYTYDTQTGIRDFQTVNVSGNLSTGIYTYFYKSIPLGNHEITLRANGEYGFNRYANMIGEDGPMRKQVVYSNSFGYTAEAGYTFNGKYTVGGRFYSLNMFSRTNSDVRANTVERRFTPQMWMNLKLPYNISFNATMNYIIIKGMDNRGMDPNHCLLNANLNYQLNDNWSFKVEGYDILNQQKPYTNVISAAGRTQTIVNALPRYVMLTVGYKFNTKKK